MLACAQARTAPKKRRVLRRALELQTACSQDTKSAIGIGVASFLSLGMTCLLCATTMLDARASWRSGQDTIFASQRRALMDMRGVLL